MRHPMRIAAAAALFAAPLAGCAASTTNGSGTVVRSTAPTGSPTGTGGVAPSAPTGSSTTLSTVTGRTTALQFSPGFLSALVALRITPAAVGGARVDGGTATLDLPITGGRLTVAGTTVDGRIEHKGSGLSLQSGGVTITFADLVIDEGRRMITSTVLANGKTAAPAAAVLDVDVNAREAATTADGVSITGQTARISAAGAALLNASFSTTAVTAGTLVGSLTITATG